MRLIIQYTKWIIVGLGLAAFLALAFSEFSTEQDDSLLDWVADITSMLLTLASSVGVAYVVKRMQFQHEEKIALIKDLKVARSRGSGRPCEAHLHVNGLKDEVDRQFRHWALTPAERSVGLMVLQGLAHKEIAALRGTTEATVRQQAQSIYRKAQIQGKTAFCAYFIENLLTAEKMELDTIIVSSRDSRIRHEH